MPIYKGTNEVASGNLYKGSTEIQDGYKATDSFYVNEVTVTLNFSVSGNASLAFSSTTITGAPGSSFSQITNNITANSGYYITGGSCSDDNPSITCAVVGSQVRVNGTIPSVASTVNISVTVSTNAYIDVTIAAAILSPWTYVAGTLPSGFNYQAGTSNSYFDIYFASNVDRDAANVSGTRASFRSKFSGSAINVNERSTPVLTYFTNRIRVAWDAVGPSFETTSSGTLAGGNTNCSVSIGLPFRLIGPTTSFVDIQGS